MAILYSAKCKDRDRDGSTTSGSLTAGTSACRAVDKRKSSEAQQEAWSLPAHKTVIGSASPGYWRRCILAWLPNTVAAPAKRARGIWGFLVANTQAAAVQAPAAGSDLNAPAALPGPVA